MQTESNIKPKEKFKIENIEGSKCTVLFFDLDSIVENEIKSLEEKATTMYSYDIYRMQLNNRNNLAEEIEKNYNTWLEYVKTQEYEILASEVRNKRNKLLEETDKDMTFDRLGFDIPSSITMTTIITVIKDFFDTLKNATVGDLAKYRQELRDLTKQKGFPYKVDFPQKPTKDE